MADNCRRSWLQIRLRTILWIMFCVGIALGMYWQGFQAGRIYKEPPPESSFGYAQVYYVEDLISFGTHESTRSGLDGIRQQITGKVLPASWTENGGKANIRVFESNLALVVMHDELGQEQVASYLASLRGNASNSKPNPRE